MKEWDGKVYGTVDLNKPDMQIIANMKAISKEQEKKRGRNPSFKIS